ncbi:MAG: DUF262 domain-containing protein [Paludibacter sp.]
MTEIDKPKIMPLGDVLQNNLVIPYYQRPYRWKAEKHVKQLIEDIDRELNNTTDYRIGSIILHKNDIVDGQQRLVTVALILNVLTPNFNTSLFKQEFRHADSKDNIKYNYNYINSYYSIYDNSEKEKIAHFILTHCSVIVVKLNELSEAFQLFDSQNARGKALDPVDLLKAYHLREMQDNTELEKKNCVANWEKAINANILNTVVGKHLFRIRNWKKHNQVYNFTKDDIDQFKGVNVLRLIQSGKFYPYLAVSFQTSISTHFVIDETIINGHRFFNYINHYVEIYRDLKTFQDDSTKHDLSFYYSGWYRTGDKRLKSLFVTMLMCYVDKFGYDDCFKEFTQELYRWIYVNRLMSPQIRYQTVRDIANSSDNPISLVDSWFTPDIKTIRRSVKKIADIDIKKDITDLKACLLKLENNGRS